MPANPDPHAVRHRAQKRVTKARNQANQGPFRGPQLARPLSSTRRYLQNRKARGPGMQFSAVVRFMFEM